MYTFLGMIATIIYGLIALFVFDYGFISICTCGIIAQRMLIMGNEADLEAHRAETPGSRWFWP